MSAAVEAVPIQFRATKLYHFPGKLYIGSENRYERKAKKGSSRQLCARPPRRRCLSRRGMKELKPRVFVVDNDQQVRISLADLLAREAYTVEIFASERREEGQVGE